jgi:hypothetical protein
VIFGGDHNPGIMKTDGSGGVHYGLGDFVFGCECSGAVTGKALSLKIGREGFEAREYEVKPGSLGNGFITMLN